MERGIMNAETFNLVAWEAVRDALNKKAKLYKLWYRKQDNGHCGTGEMLKRWDNGTGSWCPICKTRVETSKHQNRCNNRVIMKVLEEGTAAL